MFSENTLLSVTWERKRKITDRDAKPGKLGCEITTCSEVEPMSRRLLIGVAALAVAAPAFAVAQTCPYDPRCLNNPYGAGSPYAPNGINNPYSQRGSRYSNDSARNPYATNAPRIYDQNGNYRGRLSSNPYDSESTSNPYGRYGSRYSSDSINNPYARSGTYYVED